MFFSHFFFCICFFWNLISELWFDHFLSLGPPLLHFLSVELISLSVTHDGFPKAFGKDTSLLTSRLMGQVDTERIEGQEERAGYNYKQ